MTTVQTNLKPAAANDGGDDTRERSRLGFIALVTAFVSAAVVLNWNDDSAGLPYATLEDGRIIKVEAMTLGTHAFRTGPKWKEWVQRKLGRGLSHLAGASANLVTSSIERETLVIWFTVTPKPGAHVYSPPHPAVSDFWVECDSGERFPGRRLYDRRHFKRRPLFTAELNVWPRRDRSFSLSGKVDGLPFVLDDILNPEPTQSWPAWTPAEFPVTSQLHGIDVVLNDAFVTLTNGGDLLSVDLSAYSNGIPKTNWFRERHQLADATGNLGTMLSSNEPVWEVRSLLQRTYEAPWSTNEYIEFALPDIPGPTNVHSFAPHRTFGRFELFRVWICGPGDYEFTNGTITSARPFSGTKKYGGRSDSRGSSRSINWPEARLMMDAGPHRADETPYLIDANGRVVRLNRRSHALNGIRNDNVFMYPFPKITAPGTSNHLTAPFTVRITIEEYTNATFRIDPQKLRRIHRLAP